MKHLPEFRVNPFAPAGIFLILFALPRSYAFSVVTVTLLHEAGHAAAALMIGKKVTRITLMPVGITMTVTQASSYVQEIVIAAAGPVQNVLLMLCSPLFPCGEEIFTFATISLAVNLAPMATLDGGRLLCAAVSSRFGAEKGESAVRAATAICLFFLWTVAVYIFFYTAENAALLIFCSYIFSAFILSQED